MELIFLSCLRLILLRLLSYRISHGIGLILIEAVILAGSSRPEIDIFRIDISRSHFEGNETHAVQIVFRPGMRILFGKDHWLACLCSLGLLRSEIISFHISRRQTVHPAKNRHRGGKIGAIALSLLQQDQSGQRSGLRTAASIALLKHIIQKVTVAA